MPLPDILESKGCFFAKFLKERDAVKIAKDLKKKSKVKLLGAALLFCMALLPGPAWAALSGTGTAVDPYLISSPSDLEEINDYLPSAGTGQTTADSTRKYFKLTQDIDLGGGERDSAVIGYYSTDDALGRPFNGEFDGGGHTISGLNIVSSAAQPVGLFAWVSNGVIKNLTVIGDVISANITGSNSQGVGGIVGSIEINTATINGASTATKDAVIENCAFRGSVTAVANSAMFTGGIVGSARNAGVILSGDVNYGRVTGWASAGGVAGKLAARGALPYRPTRLINCVNYGKVSTERDTGAVGGVAGTIGQAALTVTDPNAFTTVSGCVNLGDVEAPNTASAGAILGGILGSSDGHVTVEKCVSAGNVWPQSNHAVGKSQFSVAFIAFYNITDSYKNTISANQSVWDTAVVRMGPGDPWNPVDNRDKFLVWGTTTLAAANNAVTVLGTGTTTLSASGGGSVSLLTGPGKYRIKEDNGVSLKIQAAKVDEMTAAFRPDDGYYLFSLKEDGQDVTDDAEPNDDASAYIHKFKTSNNGTLEAVFAKLGEENYGVSLTPGASYAFPEAEKGYESVTPLSVKVTNTGSNATGELAIALDEEDENNFTLVGAINNIAKGEESSFTVAPIDGLDAGTYTATVKVTGGDGIDASLAVSFTVTEKRYAISLSLTMTNEELTLKDGIYRLGERGAYYGQNLSLSGNATVTVVNTGNQPTGPLTLTGGASSISIPSIDPGQKGIGVTSVSKTLPAGDNVWTLTVKDSNDRIAETLKMGMKVNPLPITLSQTSMHTFTLKEDNTHEPLTVTITNTDSMATHRTGALTVTLSGAGVDSFTLNKTSVTSINGGATGSFTVTPKADLPEGAHTATVTVSNDYVTPRSFDVKYVVFSDNDPTYSIYLDRTGLNTFPGAIQGYDEQGPLTVTVTNTGNRPTGTLTVALSGDDEDSFTLNKDTIADIARGETDTFTVTPNTGLEPENYETPRTYTATVTVSGGNGIDSKTLNVSFTVNPPDASYGISLSGPDQQQLDDQHQFVFDPRINGYVTAPAALVVTVTNTGNRPTGPLTVALTGTDASSFTLDPASLAGIGIGLTGEFRVVPEMGLEVKTHSATVTVSGENNIEQQFDVSFTVNMPEPVYGIALSVPNAGRHTFDDADVGYDVSSITPLVVTVTNTGNQPTGQLAISLSGLSEEDFDLSTRVINNIPAESYNTASFTVTPKSDLGAATYEAAVTVSGGELITSQSFNVRFTVNAIQPTYGIDLDAPATHSFPPVTEGYANAPAALAVTVTNSGNQATGALSILLSGADGDSFSLSKTSISNIAPEGTDSFTVAPLTGLPADAYSATVTVSGGHEISRSFNVSFTVNAEGAGNPAYSVTLSETGTIAFPSANAGYAAPAGRSVTVTNSGNQATGALSILLSGADGDSFSLSKTSISNIAPEGTDSFTVAPLTGLPADAYSATVTVSGGNGITRSFGVTFTVRAGSADTDTPGQGDAPGGTDDPGQDDEPGNTDDPGQSDEPASAVPSVMMKPVVKPSADNVTAGVDAHFISAAERVGLPSGEAAVTVVNADGMVVATASAIKEGLVKSGNSGAVDTDLPIVPLPVFKTEVPTKGRTAAITIKTQLDDFAGEYISSLTVLKLKSDGNAVPLGRAPSPDGIRDGQYIFTNAVGEEIPQTRAVAKGTWYYLSLAVTDNGDYDWDTDEYVIIDPVAIAASRGDASSDLANGSSGGCDSGAFGVLALAAFGFIAVLRKRGE